MNESLNPHRETQALSIPIVQVHVAVCLEAYRYEHIHQGMFHATRST